MADFGFDSPVVTDDDLNPALQDFLQREQGQLAELGEDALGFDDQPQPVDDDVTHVRAIWTLKKEDDTMCSIGV